MRVVVWCFAQYLWDSEGNIKRQKQGLKGGAIEASPPVAITRPWMTSNAPTLAKSFASPPLAAIMANLCNESAANPTL